MVAIIGSIVAWVSQTKIARRIVHGVAVFVVHILTFDCGFAIFFFCGSSSLISI
jgi:hypothetical protein